jgi:hydroxymethylbilane synthase
VAHSATKPGSERLPFAQDFRRFFLRGLAIVLPPILTVWILFQLWLFLDQHIGNPANSWVRKGVAYFTAESYPEPPTKTGYVRLGENGPYVLEAVAWVTVARRPSSFMPRDPNQVHDLIQKAIQNDQLPNSPLELYERFIFYEYYQPWHLSFIGLLFAAVAIYFAGRFLATFIGGSLWQLAEHTLFRLPVVRAVYPHVKQFIDFLLSDRPLQYNRVVAVEYPRRGVWSLGLVTGEGIADLEIRLGQELLTVFVPYSPTSMTGYAITVPRSEVLDLSVSVDEAIRFVVSGGVIRPHRLASLATAKVAGVGEPVGDSLVRVHQRPPQKPVVIRVGTRGSQLARVQAQWVADRLVKFHAEATIELVEIKSSGDVSPERKLSGFGGMGIFTKEIQRALLDGEVDIAVHSLKDLPTTATPGLIVAAVPDRAPAWDTLVSPQYGDWRSLPAGSVLGTSSVRRRAQLLRLRPELEIREVRGNVQTRLRKIEQEGLAGVVLAQAGLHRLGLEHRITHIFTCDEMLPAPAQGALAIECRDSDQPIVDLLRLLDDPLARATSLSERALLRELGGGCHVPIGALATQAGDELLLRGGVFSPDGSQIVVKELSGPADEPERLGANLARRLLESGASELLSGGSAAAG